MQQLSNLGFGTDATVLSGYALRASDRFGACDFIFENVGTNTATLQLRELVSGFPAYTYANQPAILGNQFTVAAGGVVTKHVVVASEQIGIFGSGNTQVNVTLGFRNPADRRASPLVECIAVGKQGWGTAPGYANTWFQGQYPNI